MPSKCVPWIVVQVLSSTITSSGSLRIPKRPSKDENLFSTGGGTLESSVTHTVLTPPANQIILSILITRLMSHRRRDITLDRGGRPVLRTNEVPSRYPHWNPALHTHFWTPPANQFQIFWLKMPSKCVPWLVIQVLSSTRTSRGFWRPPKQPSKAENHYFGPEIQCD